MIKLWVFIVSLVAAIIVALIVGFILGGRLVAKQFKKNDPINEKQIRVMFQQMGVTPSEKKVRQVVEAMRKNQ